MAKVGTKLALAQQAPWERAASHHLRGHYWVYRRDALLVTTFLAMVAAEQAPTAPASAPPVVVPASSDEATVTVHLTDVDALTPQDITAGPLASALKPNYHVVAEFRKIDVAGEPKNWTVTLVIGNLIPFGESTVPLLVRGQLRQTLRFQKPGLVATACCRHGFKSRKGSSCSSFWRIPPRLLIREFGHAGASTMLRSATPSRMPQQPTAVPQATPIGETNARMGHVRGAKTHPVSLRVTAPAEWFRDAQTGFPRAARRNGMLTLQYPSDTTPSAIYEQILPLDVQFNPGDLTIFWNLLRIAWWLAFGAVVALGLRVVIPNYRRKESLKDQLSEAKDAIRDISKEAALQVRLKAETLALDQLRQQSWIVGLPFKISRSASSRAWASCAARSSSHAA